MDEAGQTEQGRGVSSLGDLHFGSLGCHYIDALLTDLCAAKQTRRAGGWSVRAAVNKLLMMIIVMAFVGNKIITAFTFYEPKMMSMIKQ